MLRTAAARGSPWTATPTKLLRSLRINPTSGSVVTAATANAYDGPGQPKVSKTANTNLPPDMATPPTHNKYL